VILRHTFTPHNNTRLTHLCGPADAHLRTIEIALGVKIAHRHEQFKIDGPKAKANEALELLQALYEIRAVPICAPARPTRRCIWKTSPITTSASASARPARARPIWPWPAPWTRWSAAPCSASC